jgi:hypothetical protein
MIILSNIVAVFLLSGIPSMQQQILSGGGVTNIINEWKQGLGSSVADELRELAVALKKIGITPAQCALGSRVKDND